MTGVHDSSERVKISLGLGEGTQQEEEGIWAKPLGYQLFEICDTPLLAYDVHHGDVVSCEERPDERPRLRMVVHRSGHRTLRVLFGEDSTEVCWQRVLKRLSALGAMACEGWQRFYAIDIPPTVDYEAICYYLWEQEVAGDLQYETGMTRPYQQSAAA